MSTVLIPIPMEARLAARITELPKTLSESHPHSHYAISLFLEHTLAMAMIVLPVMWMLDAFIELESPFRWALFFLLPAGTLAGLVLSGVLAGIIWCGDE